MRRHVELRAGVAVDEDDVAVIRAERADALLVIDLEPRERRPGARVFGRDQQREVDEPRTILCGGLCRKTADCRDPSRTHAASVTIGDLAPERFLVTVTVLSASQCRAEWISGEERAE